MVHCKGLQSRFGHNLLESSYNSNGLLSGVGPLIISIGCFAYDNIHFILLVVHA